MNDKKQLSAMGEEMRLTEQQAKVLADQMPKTGVLQILNDEPMCMAKRVEELEEQVRVMAELLRELRDGIEGEWCFPGNLDERIDAALAGKLPAPVVPEGWQLVPVEPTAYQVLVGRNAKATDDELCVTIYRAMLSAAPKPEAK